MAAVGETCDWLIEVPSGNPEPDSYADTIKVVECGLPTRPHGRDGAICDNGHEFGNMEERYEPFGQAWEDEQRMAGEGYGY